MTTSPAGIAGVFDRAADDYDAVGVPWFGPIAAGLVAELAAQPGERVLDVGCGRGAALRPLAEAVGPTGSALGVDLAPRMVERTAQDLAGLPHVEVRVGDASALALPAASYDVVASSLVLFFLPDPAAAVRSWAELLVPGGRLGVTTFAGQDERWRAVDAAFEPYLPPQLREARAAAARGPFSSDEGVEDLLRGAGLVDVRTVRAEVETVVDDVERLIAFTWSHGQRALWEAVPEDRRDEVAAQVAAAATAFAGPDGRLSFAQQVRYTLGRRA